MDLHQELVRRFRFVDGHADVWGWFADAEVFTAIVAALADPFAADDVTKVVGVESRGFLLGAPVALALNAGFAAVRKDGGLFAGEKLTVATAPDYRNTSQRLRMQRRALGPSDRAVIVDDWLETGNQAFGMRELVRLAGATYVGASVVVDDLASSARERLGRLHALVRRDDLGPDR
jgi:adenine phosphoribosyltransferase